MPSDWSTSPVLLVSALPIGQHGESNPCAEMLIETVLAPLGQGGHYFDLTYGSGKAVELAKAKGIRHQDGRVMLEAQAHKSFQLWKTELERFSPSETP
jgi:shikimate 5-dehydrogenase